MLISTLVRLAFRLAFVLLGLPHADEQGGSDKAMRRGVTMMARDQRSNREVVAAEWEKPHVSGAAEQDVQFEIGRQRRRPCSQSCEVSALLLMPMDDGPLAVLCNSSD